MTCEKCLMFTHCRYDLERNGEPCEHFKSKEIKTQIDRIRNMSVEELAELFLHNHKCNKCAFNFLTIGCNGNCFEGITKYLESEVDTE